MFHAEQKIGVYTLVKRLGRGSFGEVWLAKRHGKFATTQVAVKLPLDEQVDHTLIEQEAQVWAKASGHPNVLPIIEANEYDGQVAIVSEYAPDGSLEQLLEKNGGKLPLEQTVEMTIGILKGLEFLHSRKIIHRDLKPANILLQGETPRLADFGISRVIKTSLHASAMAGTPYYMSPEAFRRERTVQTDIWSVGVMLYQMLKGELPFSGNDIAEIFCAVKEEEPKPLPKDIPLSLEKIVMKSLAKEPAKRHQTAEEMRKELKNFWVAHSRPSTSSLAPQSFVAPTVKVEPSVMPVPSPKPKPIPQSKTNRLYFFVPGVVLLLAVIIIGYLSNFGGTTNINTNKMNKVANTSSDLTSSDYAQRGYDCGVKEDHDCAIENYTKAINLDMTDSASYTNRGVAYLAKSNYDEAIADFTRSIQLNPDSAEAYNNRGAAHNTKGDNDKAIADLNKAIELKPNYAEAYRNRGVVYEKKGKHDQSIADNNKAIQLNPAYADAYVGRGISYFNKGSYDQAIKNFNKAIDLNPLHDVAYNARGVTNELKGYDESAIADYRKALSINPDYKEAKDNLEKILKKKGHL